MDTTLAWVEQGTLIFRVGMPTLQRIEASTACLVLATQQNMSNFSIVFSNNIFYSVLTRKLKHITSFPLCTNEEFFIILDKIHETMKINGQI